MMFAVTSLQGNNVKDKMFRKRAQVSKTIVASSGRKSAPRGVGSVENTTVRNNLMGVSPYMDKKGWVDAQGRKGKGFGVYRFANKYGANVDGYSPIYSPDEWSASGSTFSLGKRFTGLGWFTSCTPRYR